MSRLTRCEICDAPVDPEKAFRPTCGTCGHKGLVCSKAHAMYWTAKPPSHYAITEVADSGMRRRKPCRAA
jgi:hypothetical protein